MKKHAVRGRVIIAAAMLLASSACAYGVGTTNHAGRPVQLQVTNHSGGPMDVYAAGSGTSYRVGTVHPGLAQRFEVRPGIAGNGAVEFVARAADGHLIRSGPMLVSWGDVVDFALTPHIATSTATVRSWVSGR